MEHGGLAVDLRAVQSSTKKEYTRTMNNDKLGFNSTELFVILEAIVRFKQDVEEWGYIIPKGSSNEDLSPKYREALNGLQEKIHRHLDGESEEA